MKAGAEREQIDMTPNPTDPEAALPVKKKRKLPDPDVEVIALSPETLQAETRFVCEVCGKEFPREQNLQLHRRGHNLPLRPRPAAASKRRRVYVCPEPGCVHHSPARALGDITGIKKHFCRKHGEKRWACERCGKRYAFKLDLNAHAKANTCGTHKHRLLTRGSVPALQSPDLEAKENVDKHKEKGEEEETEQPPSGKEAAVTEKGEKENVDKDKVKGEEETEQPPSGKEASVTEKGEEENVDRDKEKGEEETEQPPSGKEAAVTEKVPSPPTLPQEPSTTCSMQATGTSSGARGSMEERWEPSLVSVPHCRSTISSTSISHPSVPASVSGSSAASPPPKPLASMASTSTMAPIVSDLINFLNASPTTFHAVDEVKRRLKAAGYGQLSEQEEWTRLEPGRKYFFTINHSTIIAFAIGAKYVAGNGFHIIGAHMDSPCLKLKPVSKVTKGGNLEVGVQPYGDGLWYTWFDRDLTIAGRVSVRENTGGISYAHKLIRVQEPIMRIPTLAIHLDRTISSEGLKINNQCHVVPVLATCIKNEMQKLVGENGPNESSENKNMKHHPLLLQLIAKEANCEPDDISDFELQLCDTQPSTVAGAMKEFIFSGRLDNLCMSFCSLKALIDSTSADHSLDHELGVRMVALFDHMEVGSNSSQGADSSAVLNALSKITESFNTSNSKLLEKAIQRSFLVAADMAHALHPILWTRMKRTTSQKCMEAL